MFRRKRKRTVEEMVEDIDRKIAVLTIARNELVTGSILTRVIPRKHMDWNEAEVHGREDH